MFCLRVCICTTCVPGTFKSEDVGTFGTGVYGVRCFRVLASVQVLIEVRGVRFPLGLKLQRAVNCLMGVLGIEVRFSWRCIFLRLYFVYFLNICVCLWEPEDSLQELFFFYFLFRGVNSGCQQQVFYQLSHLKLGFSNEIVKTFQSSV